ncbi:MAG: hypothetical protein ACYDC5_12805 [Candidatus Dormibacteria bacterium]
MPPGKLGQVAQAGERGFDPDLILLHAPLAWDCRDEVMSQRPPADVVPTTDELEMYPIGPTRIATYLELNHHNVRVLKSAYRMVRDAIYDVAAHLRRLPGVLPHIMVARPSGSSPTPRR